MTAGSQNSQPGDPASKDRAEFRPLLAEATRDLYRKNAFRFLGLGVDASVREVAKQGGKIKQMQELGLDTKALAPAYPPNPPLSKDEFRGVMQRLADPVKRVVDEFFLFLPADFAKSGEDPAILAVLAGDTTTAVKLWDLRESQAADDWVAVHNLAVAWHLTALEMESQVAQIQPPEAGRARIQGYWTQTLQRWARLAGQDPFWQRFRDRLGQLNEMTLSRGVAHQFRHSLPEAIAGINGQLAVDYMEQGEPALAALHAGFMRDLHLDLAALDRVAERVLAAPRDRLKNQMRTAQSTTAGEKPAGARVALELAQMAGQSAPLFDMVCSANSTFRIDLFDDIAAACNQMVEIHHEATKPRADAPTCLAVLEATLPLTTFAPLRKRMEGNRNVLVAQVGAKARAPGPATPHGNTAAKPPPARPQSQPKSTLAAEAAARVLLKQFGVGTVAEVISRLQALENGNQTPAEKVTVFDQMFRVKLEVAVLEMNPESAAAWELCAGVVGVLRAIGRQAMGGARDLTTASRATFLAFKFAHDPALWQLLRNDQTGLRQAAMQNLDWYHPKKIGNHWAQQGINLVYLIVVGFIVIGALGCFASCNSGRPNPNANQPFMQTHP